LSLSAVHDAVYFGQRLSCQDDRWVEMI
jgi:hypothetical protein